MNIKRCHWCNLNNPLYIQYHDEEWGVKNFDDAYLFEMLVLEILEAGLSFECILNKREDLREALDNFNVDKIMNYDDRKITELLNNKKIIRNKLKIKAIINNAKIFKKITLEYGSFANYLKVFIPEKTIYEIGKTSSPLSLKMANDLKKRKMQFVGSIVIYSYLQAIGVIYSHEKDCYLFKETSI